MSKSAVREVLSRLAGELGFERVGVASVGPLPREAYVRSWLARGRAGRMQYLHRNLHSQLDPGMALPGARSVIVVAGNYHTESSEVMDERPRGRVARYAWGRDYHRVMKKRLWRLADRLRAEIGESFKARVCVDTTPVIERELAARAGIGWIGKNTLVLNRSLGSYFFLGEIITTLELEPDEPATDHCGTCRKCLDACPTGAFPAPYEMDASRCISYLTIELREDIPDELRSLMGDWVFGCDICQEVCPFNGKAPTTDDPDYQLRSPGARPLLLDLLAWTTDDWDRNLRGSAMRRATLPMLQRNARIALENHNRT